MINLRNDIHEQVNVKDQNPLVVKEITQKLDNFKATLQDCPPSLFQMEWYTDGFTNRQRREAIDEAIRRGVKPASE